MNANFNELYACHTNLVKRMNEVATEAERISIRAEHSALKTAIKANGRLFACIYRLYENAMDAGNELIDFYDCYDFVIDDKVPEILQMLRDAGIEKFTYSASWSGAVETAWAFVQNGCTLEGMVEVNRPSIDHHTGEHEKAHGYLFKVN